MIDVRNLTKHYGRVVAVDDISFHVDEHQVVGFLGPNGAGKSTTLKILTCYIPATSGQASVAGCDVFRQSMQVREKIGYMPEHVPLPGEMKVRQYLRFRGKLRGLRGAKLASAIDRACQLCWLSEPEDMTGRLISTLSRGYRQRVGLADALLHSPPVLVLDEPTLGLDPNQIRQMRSLIRRLGREHTVIFSSHILAEVEQICTHIVLIAGGTIAAAGSVDALRRQVTGPGELIVELRGDSPDALAQAVGRLAGAEDVQTQPDGDWTRLMIRSTEDADLREAVASLATERGWPLRELRRRINSLEDFFVQMTYRQATENETAGAPGR